MARDAQAYRLRPRAEELHFLSVQSISEDSGNGDIS